MAPRVNDPRGHINTPNSEKPGLLGRCARQFVESFGVDVKEDTKKNIAKSSGVEEFNPKKPTTAAEFWRMAGGNPKAPSATCKRLGSRAAAVFEAIFGLLNVPCEYQRLLLFLFGFGRGENEIEAYLGELANAYYAEQSTNTQNWKRAAKAREQRFGDLLAGLRDWQDSRSSQLALYFPGEKIDGRSQRGKILLPVADLFARIYRESKSTSAFQSVREAKVKSVAERVIASEFESMPPPERRKPRSMSRADRIKREIACLQTRTRKLAAELSEAERAEFWASLDQIKAESIPLLNKKIAVEDQITQNSHFDIKSGQPTVDFKGDTGKLDAEVESPPVTLNGLSETDQGSQGGPAVSPLLDSEPDQLGEQTSDGFGAVEAFKSVGASVDQVIFKNDLVEEAESNNRITTERFAAELTELIGDAERGGVSLIARVRGPVLQLDDCDSSAVSLLSPFAFLTVETSPKNYQCWIAFRDSDDKAAARDRLFARLRELAPGVNPGAGGAIRWPGSINFKPERNGWRVRIRSVNPGRTVSPSELEDAGLLADPPPTRNRVDRLPNHSRSQTWPDYEKCLRSKPTRSEADAQFVWIALGRGFAEAEIAAKLSEVSERAQKSGERYVACTLARVTTWSQGKR